jgi:hypothetical protein
MDPLEQAKSRPLFVEEAVRTALRDAVAWRIGGGQAPSAHAFTGAAIASARIALDAIDASPAERSRTLTAVQRVAERFTRSALYRRVMLVPSARFVRLLRGTHDADVIVRDRRRRLHAIVLTVARDAFDAGRIATRIASATSLGVGDRLNPLTVHVFSLGTGHRLTFERDVLARPPVRSGAARVA